MALPRPAALPAKPGKAPPKAARVLAVVVSLLVLAGGVSLLVLWGSSSSPHAPALRDDPVYQNNQEGLRFLAPEGWAQYANAAVPPGKAEKPRLLTAYRRRQSGKEAILEVSLADLPASTNLTAYLSGPGYGADRWRSKGAPQEIQVNGVPATRLTLVGRAGPDDLTREVVVFRRGERSYFFTGVFLGTDAQAREEMRRAVGSVLWKD